MRAPDSSNNAKWTDPPLLGRSVPWVASTVGPASKCARTPLATSAQLTRRIAKRVRPATSPGVRMEVLMGGMSTVNVDRLLVPPSTVQVAAVVSPSKVITPVSARACGAARHAASAKRGTSRERSESREIMKAP